MDVFDPLRQAALLLKQGLYNNLALKPCLLCGLSPAKDNLCPDCRAILPRLGRTCYRCGHAIAEGELCGQCLTRPPLRHRTRSLFSYHPPIDKLISDMKYHGNLAVIDTLSELFADYLLTQSVQIDCLIPIPLHKRRLRQRGFNQAVEIAKILSKRLNIDLDTHRLIRTKNTQAQAHLAYSLRRKNVENAFHVESVPLPERIALIDDVLTTGNTVEMAAKTCLKAGVKTIEVWTISTVMRDDVQ